MKIFRTQVKAFWQAFFQEEKSLRSMLDHVDEYQDKLLQKMQSLTSICFQACLFELGLTDNGRYELILTPNGDPLVTLYYRYVIEHAPKILHRIWDFYYARPQETKENFSLEVNGTEVKQREIILYPTIRDQRFHLEVYAEAFQPCSEGDRLDVMYAFLDLSISELYTMKYIQEVTFLSHPRDGGITLDLLRHYMDEIMEQQDWPNRHHPLQVYSNFAMIPKKADFYLREDVYSGISTQLNLMMEMIQLGDAHVKEAKENGIQVGFLFYEHSQIPAEQLLGVREQIDEHILLACAKKQVAENIGAANGLYYTYLDYVVYDWERFVKLFSSIMEDVETQIYGFQPMIIGAQPLHLVDNRPKGEG